MSFVLDQILREVIFEGPETISSQWYSEYFDISGTEDDFAVILTYDNGSAVEMTLKLQYSNDLTNWFDVDGSSQAIVDDSGAHMWDIGSSSATFCRVSIEVTAGSIDLTRIQFDGKRRH